ncbi:hypothetical protein BJX65DRAFT_315334 [Aspergillus insuetus]
MTWLLVEGASREVWSQFMDLGAVVTDFELGRVGITNQFRDTFFQKQEGKATSGAKAETRPNSRLGFLVSDVSQAALTKRADGLKDMRVAAEAALSGMNRMVFEDGLHFFFISLDWLEAFRALLEFYPNLEDIERLLLNDRAIQNDSIHAAEALLELGAPVSAYDFAYCKSNAMEALLMEVFLSRRRGLLDLARSTLPKRVQDKLGLRVGCLPDANAKATFIELKARNPAIDQSLEPLDSRSVFHAGMRIDHLESL